MNADMEYRIHRVQHLPFAKISILCLTILFLYGCAKSPTFIEDIRHTIRFETDFESLEKGFDAFRRKEYAKAIELFEVLSNTSGSEEIRQKALYGLAVSKLVVAKNAAQYRAAVGLWQAWSEKKGSIMASDCEDPRLMEPFFLCRYPIDFESMQFESGTAVCSETVPKAIYAAEKSKVRLLESQSKNYRSQIESLKLELENLARIKGKEIRLLKEKIRALEAIDQNIQEKKTKVSTPQ
jgi:hypothetical protein